MTHFYNTCLNSFNVSVSCSGGIVVSSSFFEFSLHTGFYFTILLVIFFPINSSVALPALCAFWLQFLEHLHFWPLLLIYLLYVLFGCSFKSIYISGHKCLPKHEKFDFCFVDFFRFCDPVLSQHKIWGEQTNLSFFFKV